MKTISTLLLLIMLFPGKALQAQLVDSIFFHLYTDSLKKGTYNYINVDGKTNNGKWLPLTAHELKFSSSAGKFQDNSLVLDNDFNSDSVVVTAVLKADSKIRKTITIYIKKLPDNEILKTTEEIMQEMKQPKRRKQVTGKS
ncbi:MAG: hypothetical protein ABIN89_11795 [Chitinophagaceae bacterium]